MNVDAFVGLQPEVYSIGLVMRDHRGMFVEAKVMSFPSPTTVLEAECIGVKEALSWVAQRGVEHGVIETDSLLKARAIEGKKR